MPSLSGIAGRRFIGALLLCGLSLGAAALSLEAQPRGPGGFFGGKPPWEPGSILPELRKDEFLKEINFTDEQRDQLEALRKKVGPTLFQGTEEEKKQKFKDYEDQALDLLTPEQAQFWDARKAEILAEAENKPKDAASESNDKPADAQAPKAKPWKSVSPSQGGTPIVSFAPSAEAAGDDGAGSKLSFNFHDAPWTDVLERFASTADLTLDLQDTPTGAFTYRDTRSYTPTQALDVLNGYLLPRGYLLVRRDRFLVCLSITDGIPPNLAPQITAEELEERGKNELVSLVIPVRGLQADQIIGEVRELLGPQGKASALKNTNSIVVTDIASHVRRINALLMSEAAIDTRDTAFKAIPLKHVSANEAERMVRRLFGLNSMSNVSQPAAPQGPGQGGGGGFRGGGGGGWWGRRGGGDRGDRGDRGEGGGEQDPSQQNQNQGQPAPPQAPAAAGSQFANKIHVAADLRTNHLLVTASAQLIKVVEDAVRTLDTDVDANGNPLRRVDVPVTYKSYTVPGGDIAVIAQTINQIVPGVVLGQDTRSGKIHVEATPDEHERVSQLIQDLGGEGSSSVAVIHLQKMDAVQLSNTLLSLFSRDGARAPTVEADPLGRRLIVRGTPDQLLQVKTILAQLGESGDGTRDKSDRGNVRTLTLGGRDPDEILPLLKDAWSASRPNPIRIRIPSRPRTIRDRAVPGADRSIEEKEDAKEDSNPQAKPVFRKASLETESDDSQAAVDDAEEEEDEAKPAEGSAPVSMQILGDQLIISSEDQAALDRLEELYERLSAAVPARTNWTVFYLRSADATEAAQMVERLIPQSNVSTTTSSTGGGMMGSLTGGISTLGRGLMNATGLNQTLSGSQYLKIATDLRSNALYVSGPSDQVAEVEQILEVLDSNELPESLRDRLPRTIAVEYADVEEVAEVVEDVFKDAMTPENQGQMPGQRGFNPLMMFMGGGGAATGPGGRRQPTVQLTVGVDKRTNNLIVSCNDSMYQQIESLVRGIDERAKQSRQTVRVVKLATADPTLVQQTLGSIMPKVSVGTTRRTRRSTSPDGSSAGPDNPVMPNRPQNFGGGGDATRDAFMRRMFNDGNNDRGGVGSRSNRGNRNGNTGNREGGGGGRGGSNREGGGRQRNRSN